MVLPGISDSEEHQSFSAMFKPAAENKSQGQMREEILDKSDTFHFAPGFFYYTQLYQKAHPHSLLFTWSKN